MSRRIRYRIVSSSLLHHHGRADCQRLAPRVFFVVVVLAVLLQLANSHESEDTCRHLDLANDDLSSFLQTNQRHFASTVDAGSVAAEIVNPKDSSRAYVPSNEAHPVSMAAMGGSLKALAKRAAWYWGGPFDALSILMIAVGVFTLLALCWAWTWHFWFDREDSLQRSKVEWPRQVTDTDTDRGLETDGESKIDVPDAKESDTTAHVAASQLQTESDTAADVAATELQKAFDEAVAFVKAKKEIEIPNAKKIVLHALFKQASEGDVVGSQPWAMQLEARAKWDAWNSVKGTTRDDAKKKYVEEVERLRAEFFD